ncbi:MAG: hypothetical protein IJN25_04360 [Clostridia bacterium]|nr:hypothetical protein [Clostridia bacterium]
MFRNKKIVSLALVLSIIATCFMGTALVAAGEENLFVNGSFQFDNGVLSGWKEGTQDFLVASGDTGYAPPTGYTGNYIEMDTTAAQIAYSDYSVLYKKGFTYLVSGFYKAEKDNHAFITIEHRDMENAEEPTWISNLVVKQLPGTNNEWTYFAFKFMIPTDTSAKIEGIRFMLRTNQDIAGTAPVGYANLSAVKTDNLLNNSDFNLQIAAEGYIASDWKYSLGDDADTAITYSANGGMDNSSCVVIQSATKKYPYIAQNLPVLEQNGIYKLSFDFKTAADNAYASPCLRLLLVGTDGYNYSVDVYNDRVIVKEKPVDGTQTTYTAKEYPIFKQATVGKWTRYSLSFVCPEIDVYTLKSEIQLRHHADAGEPFYYDNVSLEKDSNKFAYYDSNGYEITSVKNNENAFAKLHYIGGENITALTALYTQEKTLLSLEVPSTTGTNGNRQEVPVESDTETKPAKPFVIYTDIVVPFTTPVEDDFVIRSFAWSGVGQMRTMGAFKTISISKGGAQ